MDGLSLNSTRFESHIERIPFSGCWIWMAALTHNGYGRFKVHGKTVRAHRFGYEQTCGNIPLGLELDHSCRIPCCVNPAHVEVVTRRVNNARSNSPSAVNAGKTHCENGHSFATENTYFYPGRLHRLCRACHRAHMRAYRKRTKKEPTK